MLHLIHNPAAGRGRAREAAVRVTRELQARGFQTATWTTRARGDAHDFAAALPRDATVIAIGGDGTVHEVAGACVGTDRVLGVVPVGSGDDFAHALGLRRAALAHAVDAIAAGRSRLVDTGTCNGRPFVNAAGVGFDAEVGARVRDAPAILSSPGAYLWAIAGRMRHLSHTPVRVSVDDRVMYEGPSLLVSTQNGPRTGGSFRFAPAARLDDGLLDVLIAGAIGRAGALALLPRVAAGRHLSHPRVLWVRGAHVSMAWAEPRGLHLDGETFPPCRRFDLAVRPASLHVLAP